MRSASSTNQNRKLYWLASILITYGASLAMPATYQNGFGYLPGAVTMGYEMLLKLPQALLAPSWWANPLWVSALVLYLLDKTRAAAIFSIVALLLASLVLFIGAFPPDRFEWSYLRIGYFIWLASIVELNIAVAMQLFGKAPASSERC